MASTMHVPPGLDCWYFKKEEIKKSPSVLDGLDPAMENLYRLEGARFIMNIGTTMGLKYYTKATGIIFLHRFYMFHSFKTFPRYVTACCCLFLSGKVEETPKKCADIIAVAKSLLSPEQFAEFGEDPKKKVITLESIVLQTIRFDFSVDLPYYHLLNYAKGLHVDKGILEKLVQMAWTFINDSLCTTLCLQWEPEIIAIALFYLATKLSKFKIADWANRTKYQEHWWEAHVQGLTTPILDDICHQVLDLYTPPVP